MSGKSKDLQERPQDVPTAIVVEEFSIMELEDRLELAKRCNHNCSCPAD